MEDIKIVRTRFVDSKLILDVEITLDEPVEFVRISIPPELVDVAKEVVDEYNEKRTEECL